MTLKQFRILKIAIAMVIAIVFSQALLAGNYLIPLITLTAASLLIFYGKKYVTEVTVDERDYENGGKAAFQAVQLYSLVAVVIMFVLYASRGTNALYETVAMTLSFSVISLMFLYSLLFSYHAQFKFGNKKAFYQTLGVLVIVAFLLGGLRFLSGEDSWLCEKGQWVKHGNPSTLAPTEPCSN